MRLLALRRRTRAVLLGLLACIVTLQSAVVLVRASAGPSHRHVAPSLEPGRVLHDFRRDPAAVLLLAGVAAEIAPTSRHGHAHAEGQRHHHASDLLGGTVIDADLDRREAADESSGASASVFLPIPAQAPGWQATDAMHARGEAAAWFASPGAVAPAERPPRHDVA